MRYGDVMGHRVPLSGQPYTWYGGELVASDGHGRPLIFENGTDKPPTAVMDRATNDLIPLADAARAEYEN